MKVLSNTKTVGTRLSDRIRMARHAARLSQAELGSHVGVTPGAVAQWEGPHGTKPRIERLEAIATATGAVFDWLATGRGDPRRRRKSQDDATPAVTLGSFAQDFAEEVLLDRFRRLSPQARKLLGEFLDAITSRRR
jgi:transcriptional regulator with XRE-family HTH domain